MPFSLRLTIQAFSVGENSAESRAALKDRPARGRRSLFKKVAAVADAAALSTKRLPNLVHSEPAAESLESEGGSGADSFSTADAESFCASGTPGPSSPGQGGSSSGGVLGAAPIAIAGDRLPPLGAAGPSSAAAEVGPNPQPTPRAAVLPGPEDQNLSFNARGKMKATLGSKKKTREAGEVKV